MLKGRVIATAQQRKLAQLLVEGERPLIDCYIEAYNQTDAMCKDKGNLSARAYAASKSKGVMHYIAKLQEQQAIEEARSLVWDKRKAAQRLLKMTREIEVNIEITRKLRDNMMGTDMNDVSKLNQMIKVSQICNDTTRAIKEILQEMNMMYGLSKPEVSLVNAVQVIIGSPDKLPEDTVD